MFRVKHENFVLLLTLLVILVAGFLIYSLNLYLIIGLIIFSLIYVRLNQLQYLGSAIKVHSMQFQEIYEVFKRYATKLRIQNASLYIKQDPSLNAYTLGYSTCTVVLTSSLVEQLSDQELNFVIGHELGHYCAGHTLITTLFTPLGSGNWISSLLFGIWNRKTEYSADRCGLILTKNIDSAITSLIKLSLGAKLFERFNLTGYLPQLKRSDSSSVKLSESLLDHPLATSRIKNLSEFWRVNFVKNI